MATPQPDRAMWDRLLASVPPEDLLRAGIRRDEITGAPYSLGPDGRKQYISPAAWRRVRAEDMPADGAVPANPHVPADTTGMFRRGPQWNTRTGQWDTPLDWGNILSAITGGALTAGAASAFAGGAPAAASGTQAASATLPSTQIGSGFMPGIAGGTGLSAEALAAGGAAGLGGAATVPGITSAGMEAAMPGSMAAPGGALASSPLGTGAMGPVTGGTGSAVSQRLGSLAGEGTAIPDIVRKLAKMGLPLGALLGTRALSGGGGDAGPSAISPELQQMLALSMRRMAAQEPLFEALNRQALAGLPTYARGGD